MNAPLSRRGSRSGVALVIILAFVVLLSGVVVALLSRATTNKLVSNASANVGRTDLYGHGAIDQILGDLRQEIVDGSTSVTTTDPNPATKTIYRPNMFGNAVPYRSGPYTAGPTDAAWTALPNLVKESASGVAFYKSGAGVTYNNTGVARATSIVTTQASRNGRLISLTRWNKALLLPKKTASSSTDFTPVTSFTAPAWILTASDGTNPTALATALTNPQSPSFVVGRYAYAIYNEGGLLDANVAGGPGSSEMTTAQAQLWSRKGGEAFADLTQLPDLAGLGASRAQQIVDTLVGWRNYASVQPGGTFPSFTLGSGGITQYLNFLLGLNTAGMTTGNPLLFGGQSDQMFAGRQQLNAFLQSVASGTAEQAALQNTMQYLGTFSRALNQPAVWPDSGRPKVTGPVAPAGGNGGGTGYTGGNSAYQLDDVFNPVFRSVRATSAFLRSDGTTAVIGEPLVKKRFALSRLCWITYKGPSATLGSSDPLIAQYLTEGVPQTLLNEGTATNIKNYFGLTWTAGPGPGGLGGFWTYDHGLSSGGATLIGSLNDPASPSVVSAGRDPDFFELLKAAVTAGAVAKTRVGGSGTPYSAIAETTVTFQIFQLGVNIIDQANPTQYPTHIEFNYGDTGGYRRSFYGSMDLPYFCSANEISFVSRASSVVSTPAGTPWPPANLLSGTGSTPPYLPPSATGPPVLSVSDPGLIVGLIAPAVWNPYDVNDGTGPGLPVTTGLAPTKLRIAVVAAALVDSANIPGTGVSSGAPGTYSQWATAGVCRDPQPYGSPSTAPTLASQTTTHTSGWDTEESTSLTFNNVSTLYREPTVLLQTGVPSGSGLALGPSNLMRAATGFSSSPEGMPETGGSNASLIGFFIGSCSQTWISAVTPSPPVVSPGGNYVCTVNQVNIVPPAKGSTLRLEYSPDGTHWIPYQEVWISFNAAGIPTPYVEGTSTANPSVLLPLSGGSLWMGAANAAGTVSADFNWVGASEGQPNKSFMHWLGNYAWDPRSTRWGNAAQRPGPPFIDASGASPTTLANAYMVQSERPSTSPDRIVGGLGVATTGQGWIDATGTGTAGEHVGGPTQNINIATQTHYSDPDGVFRRAMGAFAGYPSPGPGPSTTTGLPMATPAAPSSRSIVLHRPFRSVAELGYAFSDTPWRNIDFSNPESGYAALLDTFCINEDYRPDAVASGRVDLNTRQQSVIQALLAGAYRDEVPLATGSGTDTPLAGGTTTSEAGKLAALLLARTDPNNVAAGKGPLENISDVVGRYVSGFSNANLAPYDGFSADLAYSTGISANNIAQRFREAAIRAISDAGQAGTWNLLIDVVAQSGRYPAGASGLADFLVEGERRYWVHVAIDRQTGQIIDENIEPVNE